MRLSLLVANGCARIKQTKQLMADPLFEIGNHAWTHENFRVINTEMVDKQIVWTQAQYEILRDELVTIARQNGIDESEINQFLLFHRYSVSLTEHARLNHLSKLTAMD
ncbi:MAG: hypothetical protein MZV65_15350 [Chromatiales bacterium]|nr:hypothetical protein [Chromatiales bacterium]